MSDNLTDKGIRALRPRDKQYQVTDGKTRGLALRVMPSGTKAWSFQYRVGSRTLRVSLGSYPSISLARARELAADKMFEVRQGGDPAQAKREARQAADETFRGLCTRFLDRHALGPKAGPRQKKKTKDGPPPGALLTPEGKAADVWEVQEVTGEPRKRSWRRDRRMLEREIPSAWWGREPGDVTRREIIDLIDAKGRVHPVGANRLRALLHAIYNYALSIDWVEANPVAKTRRPGDEVRRSRRLSRDELRDFWRLTGDMSPPFGSWWRIRLLTAQRAGEVTNMKWSDLDFETNVWTIPPQNHKGKRQHEIPLCPMTLEVLAGMPRIEGEDYVFAGGRGKRQQAEQSRVLDFSDFRGHDLRTTFSMYLQNETELEFTEWDVGTVLGHASTTVTGKHYSGESQYLPQKRRALLAWEGFLADILGLKHAEVVQLRAG